MLKSRKRAVITRIVIPAVAVAIAIIILVVCLVELLPRHHHSSSSSEGQPTIVGSSAVKLDYGTYAGSRMSSGVSQYLGMRYAAPPVGDLRWRAPTSPNNFTGTQNATVFQPICRGVGAVASLATQSEDCLYINVFTPSSATSKSRLPVWIYIQGGGYGGDDNANYNGTEVVIRSNMSIIYVNFNYRVGAFGFLASANISNNGDLNTGLLDQRAAFQWVQNHISQFGGDPNAVVIHGASSGAGAVGLHLAAYGGRNDGLFRGAMVQSPYFPRQPKVADLEYQFTRYVNLVGCQNASDAMACLRSKNASTLQGANYNSPYPGQSIAPLQSFSPTVDGVFLTDYPLLLFQQGKFLSVPVLVGDEPNEGTVFTPNVQNTSDVQNFFYENYPQLNSSDIEDINNRYLPGPQAAQHSNVFGGAAQAYGEATFNCPGLQLLSALSDKNSSNVWNYNFNISSTQNIAAGLGATHTFDTAAILGPYYDGIPTKASQLSFTTYNAPVVPILMDYYISFVKSLSPNTYKNSTAPEWTPYRGTNGIQRLLFNTGSTAMEDVPSPLQSNCAFWAGLIETLEQ